MRGRRMTFPGFLEVSKAERRLMRRWGRLARSGVRVSPHSQLIGKRKSHVSLRSRPCIEGSDVLSQPFRIDVRECGLAEVQCLLNVAVAVLTERGHVPRQQVSLVTVQVVDCEEVRGRPVLEFAKLATPTRPSPHPSRHSTPPWRILGSAFSCRTVHNIRT